MNFCELASGQTNLKSVHDRLQRLKITDAEMYLTRNKPVMGMLNFISKYP
jgi:hypothetical protein